MVKIIAKQGNSRFLIDTGQHEQGQILDIGAGKLYPPVHIQSILGRGYWEELHEEMSFPTLLSFVNCPVCGSSLIEDVWEVVEETPSGNTFVDSFEAVICSRHCDYYIKLNGGM